MNSSVSLASAILGGVVAFMLGYCYRAVWQAFKDLRDQKAKIKPLRRSAWSWLWIATKSAALVLVVLVALVAWVVRDQRDDGATPPLPRPSPSSKR